MKPLKPLKPLVSILIPAYNAEEWIADTIKSAIGQTWREKEIIVVDDGSTDNTLSIAQQFAPAGVSVVSQPNQGAAAARNKAFSLCQGNYIQWLDADDLLSPDKIERQMRAIEPSDGKRVLLSGGWGHFLFLPRRARFVPSPLWCNLSPAEWLTRKMECDTHMQTATWLVSREITEAAGPWDTRLLGDDDGEYFCRVLQQSEGIRFVPDARTYYRMTGGLSLSQIGSSRRKIEAQLVSCRLHVEYLLASDSSDRTRAACLKYLEKYAGMFHPEYPEAVHKLEELARGIGRRISIPPLPWKYEWIARIIGRRRTKLVRHHYNQIKWTLLRAYDRAMYEREKCASQARVCQTQSN